MRERKAGGDRGAAIRRMGAQLVAALQDHLARGGVPRPPLAGVPIWQAFAALSDARTWGPGGPDPIQPAQVEAWARLMQIVLPPHHVRIIADMDGAWLEWVRKPEAERNAPPPLTAAAFDAMFG